MTRVLIRGGRLLDPSSGQDEVGDLLVEDGRVCAAGGQQDGRGAVLIEAAGAWVAPGFVDLHTHLREPGQEYKRTSPPGGGPRPPAASRRSRAWRTRSP